MNASPNERALSCPPAAAAGSLRRDWSLSAITAGFLAVLISCAANLALHGGEE